MIPKKNNPWRFSWHLQKASKFLLALIQRWAIHWTDERISASWANGEFTMNSSHLKYSRILELYIYINVVHTVTYSISIYFDINKHINTKEGTSILYSNIQDQRMPGLPLIFLGWASWHAPKNVSGRSLLDPSSNLDRGGVFNGNSLICWSISPQLEHPLN